MRWRLIDTVTELEAWQSAGGVKGVSFEEYTLREPLGREGTLPETMVMESCVELVRWLVAHSSGFELTCWVKEVRGFEFAGTAGMGDQLQVECKVLERGEASLLAACTATVGERSVGRGVLGFALAPMAESFDVEWMRGRWSDLNATA